MANKKPRPTDGGGNWMDTYGDMVTLLLTFFVMLYAMSNINEQKWEVFVQSIIPNSGVEAEDVVINSPLGEDNQALEGMMEIPKIEAEVDMNTLYLTIAERLNEMNIDGVSISRGTDYTFIEFQDKAFFGGDSSVLTEMGQQVLQVFCDVIAPAKESLGQISVMAHTAQGDPNRPNNPRTDRMLSAMRGAEVCIFIQSSGAIEPEKLVNISYGQFRPVASNDTREGREKNRRVELLMLDEGADIRALNEYYEKHMSGADDEVTIVTGNNEEFKPAEPGPEAVSGIESLSTDYSVGPSAESGPSANPTAGVAGAEAPEVPDVPDAPAE